MTAHRSIANQVGESPRSNGVPTKGYEVLKHKSSAPRLTGSLPPHNNSEIFAEAFRKRAFDAHFSDARLALNNVVGSAGTIVIPALPAELNPNIAKFLDRSREKALVWRFGTAQLPLMPFAMKSAGCGDVFSLCMTKAFSVTQARTREKAVRAIAKEMPPQSTCVVSSPTGAAAVRGGELVEIPSLITPALADRSSEGCGAAFTAGFVASLDAGASLATALMDGHITAAFFIHAGQSMAALPDEQALALSRELFREPHGRFHQALKSSRNLVLRLFSALLA